MKHRILPLLLAALLTLPLFAACGGDKPSSQGSENTPATSAAVQSESSDTHVLTPAEIRENAKDTVPEGLDFKGEAIHFYIRDDTSSYIFPLEFYAPELTGDIVNDAIHDRNLYTEERLNIKIDCTQGAGKFGDWRLFQNAVLATAMAGDGSMDIVPFYAYYHPNLAASNCYIDLLGNDVKYLDFSQPWWNQTVINNGTIDGKLFLTGGEYGISFISLMAAIAFNINLKNQYLPKEDFYQLVRDGKWTLDVLLNYARTCYHDVNGDGARDVNDIYGFDGGRSDQLIHAANVQISKKNDDGTIVLALNNERMVQLVDKLQNYYPDKSYAQVSGQTGTKEFTYEGDFFGMGRLMFSNRYVRDIVSLRDMEDDYGILPLPKLDEDQEKYKTTLADSYSTIGVMSTSKHIDATTATLEVMTAESYRHVTLTYFETALKSKYARDESTAEMLDILVDGIEIDFTETFAFLIDAPVNKMRNVLQATCAPFASTYESIEQSINQKIADLPSKFPQ